MRLNRACLISGGGSWGAFGGGTLARIDEDYDTIVGVSTGSMIAPLAALNEWEILKSAYTSVNDDDIFDVCWFKGKPLNSNGKLRKLPIIMSLIAGDKSICTSKALRKTVDKFFTEKNFKRLRQENKEILVGTQNFAQNPSMIHYFSSLNEDYEEFKDWMWCSANFPFFTSLVRKSWRDNNGNFHVGQWGDGALTDLVGLKELAGRGYKEIDIILHRTKPVDALEGNKITNLIENVTATINAMRYDIEFEYFYDWIKKFNDEGTKINVYWLPRKLSKNSMRFDSVEMSEWWDEGYETAFDSNRLDVFEPTNKL